MKIIYVFLVVITEFITVRTSLSFIINGIIDSVIDYGKKGYRLDPTKREEIELIGNLSSNKLKNLLVTLLGAVLLLIPVVNLLSFAIMGKVIKNKIQSNPVLKEAMIPMTDAEKEKFNENSKEEQVDFIFGLTDINRKPITNTSYLKDDGEKSICGRKLEDLNYSFEEVKKINATTSHSYRIGKIDGKNVAIIDVPNPSSWFNTVRLKEDNYQIAHPFESMTEEEAQNQTFSIYPYRAFIDYDTVLEEIKEDRQKEEKKKRIVDEAVERLLKGPEQTEPNEEQQKQEDNQSPVKKKTIYPKQ